MELSVLAQPIYLLLAGFCLLMAMRTLREALLPIGAIVRAAVALAVFGLSISAALVLMLAAVIAG
jgi:hypothetical protein